MGTLKLSLATEADDAELRQMLRDNPMPGKIQVTLEREPNFFIGANVEGPFHQTILVRESDTRQAIALVTRSVRPAYVNGEVGTLGYLSQVRIAPGYRSMRRAMARVSEMLRQLHQDGCAAFYLISIVADNTPARRLLAAGLPGMPHLHEYARYHTLAIYTRQPRRTLPLPAGLRLESGKPQYISALLDCLARNGRRYQFSPVWNLENFLQPTSTPNLGIQDFWLALDGERVVGCVALWDQSAFKQTVVHRYTGLLGRARGLVNAASRFTSLPRLPEPGQSFRFGFASHVAVDGDNPDIFAALIRQVYNTAAARQYSYCMLGLAEQHPHLEQTRHSYAHIDYASQLYLAGWEDNMHPLLAAVDRRPPGIEACLL